MQFTIDKEIFDKLPPLQIGVLLLTDVNNKADIRPFFDSEYAQIASRLRSKLSGETLTAYPLIQQWRGIYKSFGEKKARSSIESLLRRVVNGKDLYNINPLVDLYNLASLKFELPCGGEDVDALQGRLTLTLATGNETFIPLGETNAENPNAGEIIYTSGDIVVCRNFNHRESDLTKLTENTRRTIILFEDAGGQAETLQPALDWVAGAAARLLGAKAAACALLNKATPSLTI